MDTLIRTFRTRLQNTPTEYVRDIHDKILADCLGAATDSVGRLITVEREQLYREVFGKNVELVL